MHPFELDIYREVGFLDHIEGLKNLLMKVEEESEKVNRKHSIKKKIQIKILASSPITSWQIDRGQVEIMTDFLFLNFKSPQTVTASTKLKDTCSLKEKLWQN